jgi:hypothetical protein
MLLQTRLTIVIHVVFAISIGTAYKAHQANPEPVVVNTKPRRVIQPASAPDAAVLAAEHAERIQHMRRSESEATPSPIAPPVAMPSTLNLSADTIIHTIGIYEAADPPEENNTPWWHSCVKTPGEPPTQECFEQMRAEREKNKWVKVNIDTSSQPIVLVLTAYSSVQWQINVSRQQKIEAVIISGYQSQKYQGLPLDVPVYIYTHDQSPCEHCIIGANAQPFYAYELSNLGSINEQLIKITDRPTTTFQGAYKGYQFSIGNLTPRIRYKSS